ncbi:MAG: response regulator [Pseudomonadota bacterium]
MKKVLFIDDDVSIGEMMSLFLCRLGFQVKVAHDGEQGIELLKNGEIFNVVITDIRMPNMSGNEVARYIRKTCKLSNIYLVAITGFIEEVETDLFDCLLEKPFKVQELLGFLGTL